MTKYRAVFSVDTGFFSRLDGKYEVEGFDGLFKVYRVFCSFFPFKDLILDQ